MNKTKVDQVKAMILTQEGLFLPLGYDRRDIIQSLNSKDKWYTCQIEKEDNLSNWQKKEEIHLIEIDGGNYIKTDKSPTKNDNLGTMPEL